MKLRKTPGKSNVEEIEDESQRRVTSAVIEL
jgi:hypothetical protein